MPAKRLIYSTELRIYKVGRRWVYGWMGKKNGLFHTPVKVEKTLFPITDIAKDDKFVFWSDGKVGRRLKKHKR